MKIGIISAIKDEILDLLNKSKATMLLIKGQSKIFLGSLYKNEIIFLISGIGKVSSTIGATILIEYFSPKFIINIGTAGSISKNNKIGDIIVSKKICYHDVDITKFGFKHGQLKNLPQFFIPDKKLSHLFINTSKKLNIIVKYEIICTGDSFINTKKQIKKIKKFFPNSSAVEMEGAAIGQVCYIFKTPFIILKSISDLSNKNSAKSFKKFLKNSSYKISLIIEKMLSNLKKI